MLDEEEILLNLITKIYKLNYKHKYFFYKWFRLKYISTRKSFKMLIDHVSHSFWRKKTWYVYLSCVFSPL